MKATLEFNLDDQDDREEHLRCIKSLDIAMALDDIWSYIGKLWNEAEDDDTVNINELYETVLSILEKRDAFPDNLVS
jgi:hypothetical protein